MDLYIGLWICLCMKREKDMRYSFLSVKTLITLSFCIWRYDAVTELAVKRQKQLDDAFTLYKFSRDVDDELSWIQEKMNLASSNEYGNSLTAVQNLVKRHQVSDFFFLLFIYKWRCFFNKYKITNYLAAFESQFYLVHFITPCLKLPTLWIMMVSFLEHLIPFLNVFILFPMGYLLRFFFAIIKVRQTTNWRRLVILIHSNTIFNPV